LREIRLEEDFFKKRKRKIGKLIPLKSIKSHMCLLYFLGSLSGY
jgi:hypothetical protein